MNRIHTCAQEEAPDRLLKLDIRRAMYESDSESEVQPHALFAPLHYERRYAYPLLVWLHGPGDNESQLKRIMPLVSMRNYVAVAPRGTWPRGTAYRASRNFSWREDEEDAMLAQQAVERCIERAAERFHIHRGHVFLAGYQCGGTMAFRLGMNRPDLFAGILSVAGRFPRANRPLLRLDQCREVPLFLAHGRDGEEYSADRVCEDLRLFHTAGLSVTLRQYPCGDEITTQMLSDMDAWMMEQVTGVESLPAEVECPPPNDAN
jgi:phospholipase/carboxylesterase